MSNIFDWTEEEKLQFEQDNFKAKAEFEALNLDFYKENPEQDWYTFISHLEHYNKSWGTDKLLYSYLSIEKLQSWSKAKRCYTLGYVLYLCNKYNKQKPDYLEYFKDEKMDKILFGPVELDGIARDYYESILKTCRNNIAELKQYNIYCREIDVVVGAHK